MELLPIVIKNIIMEYKRQIELTEKFNKCILEIQQIRHFIWNDFDENIINNVSLRGYTSYSLHQMYPGVVLGILNCKTGFDVIW